MTQNRPPPSQRRRHKVIVGGTKIKIHNLRLLVLIALVLTLLIPAAAALAQEGTHFCYEGDCGPAHWATLSPDWELCGTGKEQSPVDIPATATVNPGGLKLNYQPSTLNIVNNGHSVQASFAPGSSLELDGKVYQLQQVHMHAQSEHDVAGKAYPAEAHFVHQAADGSRVVVGVFLTPGADNAAWAPFFANIPATEGPATTVAGATLKPADMLPAQQSYYRYNGSLTTPGCTEGVKWLVMNTPIQVSDAQLASFTKEYHNNFRPVQPLNGRTFLTTGAAPQALPVSGAELPLFVLALAGLGGMSVTAGLALARQRR
jgi:carbonic anhydrase